MTSVHHPEVFHYTSYREYTRAWLAARPGRTRARFAAEVGCAPALITAILHRDPAKRRKLSARFEDAFARALRLGVEETEFFLLLVAYEQAPTLAARQRAWEQISARKRFQDAHRLAADQYMLCSQWQHEAVLEMVRCRGFRPDPKWIGDRLLPPQSARQVRRALTLLVEMGLLRYDAEGRLHPTKEVILADAAEGEPLRLAMYKAHKTMLTRASQALDEFSSEERHFNAGTVTVPVARLPELKRRLDAWMKEFIDTCEDDEGEQVYRLNLQFFPLSKRTDR